MVSCIKVLLLNHELYEPYNGSNTNFNQNPNSIKTFDFKFKIPLNPKEASNKVTTAGFNRVSLNGVAFTINMQDPIISR